jgi:predicted dithiol-disulfide oxidoreductase (DUF899 family)
MERIITPTAGGSDLTRPKIVDETRWEAALERLRAKEKELTRAHDALAA